MLTAKPLRQEMGKLVKAGGITGTGPSKNWASCVGGTTMPRKVQGASFESGGFQGFRCGEQGLGFRV